MTFATSPNMSYAGPSIFRSLAKQFCKWREQRRLAHVPRKISELPGYVLRDVGLEHLRDLKTDSTFPHRILSGISFWRVIF